MAKFTTNSQTKKENASLIKMVSPVSGKAIAWVNLTDSFCKATLSLDPADVTADQAQQILDTLVAKNMIKFEVVDLTEEREVVSVENF